MTGILGALLGHPAAPAPPAGGVVASGSYLTELETAIGVPSSGNITFQSYGVISAVDANGHWYNPPTTDIGAGYWVRFTKTFGTTATDGTEGVWQQLNVARRIGYTTTTAGREGHWTAEVSSSASGTPVLGTYSLIVLLTKV